METAEKLRWSRSADRVGQHKEKCPFCSHLRKKKHERTLSVMNDGSVLVYNCWHCNEAGKIDLSEDAKYTPSELRTYEKMEPIVAVTSVQKWEGLSETGTSYLEGRGISKEVAEAAGVQESNHYIAKMERKVDCLVFPYRNKGQEYASKISAIDGKGFSCAGAPQTFFNIDRIKPDEDLIICEGELDELSFEESGISNAVSIPNGAVMKVMDNGNIDPRDDGKFRFLWNSKDELAAAKKIIIAMDEDAPGKAMAEEIARRIGKDRCWQVEYPKGCKDANDVLVMHGREAVQQIIDEAKPWPVAGLYDADHFETAVNEIYKQGIGSGESTGYANVDEYYSIVGGQISIVTGIPSSGKSEFVDQIMVNIAERKGWKFAVCSFENEPRIHIAKLIAKHIKKPFFEGPTERMDNTELSRGKNFIQDHFSFLYQADGSLSTIDSIIERIKIAVLRHGVRGAVIDPYNYIVRPRDISETDWVSEMLTRISVFAKAHDVHIFMVAHPTKMQRGVDGKIPAPAGFDISGSAAWFAKADMGVTVHRPDASHSPTAEIHIWKCRFSWVGKQGQTELAFDVPTSTYNEIKPDSFLDLELPPEDDRTEPWYNRD